MLLKNSDNLKEELIGFLKDSKKLTIIVPFIKNDLLQELINYFDTSSAQIIVRWKPEDIVYGASDLEVFETCVNHNITLYRNPRIHLKAFIDSFQRCLFGSPNISNKAITERDTRQANPNYEIATKYNTLTFSDVFYFNKIIKESTLLDEQIVSLIKDQVESFEDPFNLPENFALSGVKKKGNFLLSSLPMSTSVDKLVQVYLNKDNKVDETIINCAAHDLALFDVPPNLSKSQVYNHLKEAFNSHPFIRRLKKYVEKQEDQSINYGSVVRWIQNNTTTVPIPRSWKIKREEIVNILYHWICEFDDSFEWNRPRHSQILYMKVK